MAVIAAMRYLLGRARVARPKERAAVLNIAGKKRDKKEEECRILEFKEN